MCVACIVLRTCFRTIKKVKANKELLVWYHPLFGKGADADEVKVNYKPKAAWPKSDAVPTKGQESAT